MPVPENNVMLSGSVVFDTANPYKVEVTRGQRGNYGWTITVSGSSHDICLANVKVIDAGLKNLFPPVEGA